MGFIWFILFIIFLILWLNVSSELKRSKGRDYQRGLSDGYEMARDQARAVRESNQDDTKTLDQFLDVVEPTPLTSDEQVVAVDSSANQPESISVELNELSDNVPTPSPEEIERAKTRQTLKNLNIILYVASFLIVAATAAFVTLTMPAAVKLTGLIVVTILFYVVGLFMYARTTNLRPAAIAFVGTGLAIVPFIGFALTSLGNMSNEAAWLITSILGLVAYTVAALKLQSQLVSYITMAFVLSLALSAVSILSLGVMWYFIVVIGVSLVLNCIHILLPKLLPDLFTKPLRDTGLVVTPVALVASLLAITSMSLGMYVVLFAVSTAHYLVIWLIRRSRIYELAVRILAHLTLIVLTVYIIHPLDKNNIAIFGVIWLILAVLQIIFSLLRIHMDRRIIGDESALIGVAFGLMLIFIPVWGITDQPSHWISINLAAIAVMCAVVALKLRQVGWLYGTLAVSLILPFIVGRQVIGPAVAFEIIAGLFVFAGLATLFALERAVLAGRSSGVQLLFNVATVAFMIVLSMCGIMSENLVTLGWTLAISSGVLIAQSYIIRSVGMEVVGAILGVASIAAWVDKLLIENEWKLVVSIISAAAVLAVGAAVHQYFQQQQRRNSLIIIAAVIFAGLVLAVSGSTVVMRTATLLLLIASVIAIIGRGLLANLNKTLRSVSLVTYIVYPVLGLMLGFWLGAGWLTLVSLVITAIAWASSYLERKPSILAVGHIMFAIALSVLWMWLEFSTKWSVYGVTWISAAVYYLVYWQSYSRQDKERANISLVSTLSILAIAVFYGIIEPLTQNSLLSAGSLLMISAVVAIHGYMLRRDSYMEPALYMATLGVQWIMSSLIPGISTLVYAHWWAIVIFMAAMWRNSYKTRLVVAISFVTASTGLFALSEQGGYSLFFLAEHLVLAIVGAMARKQWVMWWGIIAVVLAVLYFLKDYTFLALLFLGLLLILFVVWRLVKLGDRK